MASISLALLFGTAQAADMVLVVSDDADSGFNDPTPVAPEGGNTGLTLGAQRRIAFEYAADILGSRIDSSVPIRIVAGFNAALTCERNSATLGAAGPISYVANFTQASRARRDVFYPLPLANALLGARVADTDNDIRATFNPNLDEGTDCLGGTRWYYGTDGATPAGRPSFVSTVEHELTHGVGFVSLVALTDSAESQAGQFPQVSGGTARFPDIYSSLIQDLSFAGDPLWTELNDEQRAESLTNGPNVVWSDINTGSRAASILTDGLNEGRVMLYAPSTVRPGSSISHWDISLDPDQIMEPFATGNDDVANGIGLTTCVLEDIGWTLANGARCPDEADQAIADPQEPTEEAPSEPVSEPAGGGSASSGGGDDGGSGGGCTLTGEGRFDPLWALLLAMGAFGVCRRRRLV
ncbi:protease-associated PA [Salinisphaera sp. T5B8]|uniref:JDVT-CTERM domain-containing protein n=1 Tax=Salinisphaera sp. T5B8 TaxID=1304154 RepID=UPI0033411E13